MRVLVAAPVYPPYRAGMATIPRDEFLQLQAAGHEVRVLTLPNHDRQAADYPEVMPVRAVQYGNGGGIIWALLAARGYDIVHLHVPFFGSDFLLAISCLAFRVPLVITYHMASENVGLVGILTRLLRATAERFTLSVAREVWVSSLDYAAANHIKHHNLRAMPFGVDVSKFKPGDRQAARARFGLSVEVPLAIFVGAMDRAHAFKGVDVLLRALVATPMLHLILVGDGDLAPEYKGLVVSLGLTDRVHFLGRLSDADKTLAYQAADFHVLPSTTKSEAFGLVTLEAMASGLPSIVSDLPGVRTLVHDGANGLTVPAGDAVALTTALQRLAGDSVLTATLGQPARELAFERYDEAKLTPALLSRLHELSKR